MSLVYRNFFLITLVLLFGGVARGDVIANKNITNRDFGIWNVSCEEDEMFENVRCIIFVEITEETTIFVNPYNVTPVLVISKDSYPGKAVFVRIDNNKLIASKPTQDGKYGIVSFEAKETKNMFEQIQSGNYFYIRFAMKKSTFPEGFREITVKFPLSEFRKAFTYYEKQVNKYSVSNSK
ncbi:MAG: hypothetical protein LBB24_01515 [Rickettsiales bacterium]|nr:hypothetical protein [Rickettsiales bacterium]